MCNCQENGALDDTQIYELYEQLMLLERQFCSTANSQSNLLRSTKQLMKEIEDFKMKKEKKKAEERTTELKKVAQEVNLFKRYTKKLSETCRLRVNELVNAVKERLKANGPSSETVLLEAVMNFLKCEMEHIEAHLVYLEISESEIYESTGTKTSTAEDKSEDLKEVHRKLRDCTAKINLKKPEKKKHDTATSSTHNVRDGKSAGDGDGCNSCLRALGCL